MSAAADNKPRVLLAYSGGLDTSCILKWLIEQGYEVMVFMADIGQIADFEAARKKALLIGASRVFIEDLKREFLQEYVFPCVQANANYFSRYLLGTSMARPCIARRQVEIAKAEGCQYVSHGCTGKGNDQVRFELTYYSFEPTIKVIAPWRSADFLARFKGRPDLIEYARQQGIPISATGSAQQPYSEDDNMFHISHESGILEDPAAAAPEHVYSWTVDPVQAAANNAPEFITIEFKKGAPVRVLNETTGETKTDTLELFLYLNALGKKHGIGRLDMVENRFVGIKSRGVYETPAGTILREAHLDLEGITLDREVARLRDMLTPRFSDLVYNGFWYSPEMDFILNSIRKSQEYVNGEVRLRLFAGVAYTIARSSPFSLYNKDLVSFDKEGGFNPSDSDGFIKINAIRLKAYHNAQIVRNAAAAAAANSGH